VDSLVSFVSIPDLAAYLAVGVLAGVLAGLLGVGGGLVIVPALIWVFTLRGFPAETVAHLAVGTSLATIIVTSISSIRAHQRRGAIRWELVWGLAPGIVVGAWLGAAIADRLPGIWLQRVFAVFLMFVAWRMLRPSAVAGDRELPGVAGRFLAGGVIGMVSAIVGIGGGTVTVPFLHACRVGIRSAIATSAACGLPIAVAGASGFVWMGLGESGLPALSLGYVYIPAFAGIVVTSAMLAPVGAKLAHTLPIEVVKRAFAVLLLVVGGRLLFGL